MQLFADNLINWLILAAGVIFLWQKFMPAAFAARKQKINAAIDESARLRKESEDFFASQKARIENVEKEFDSILTEAEQVAERLTLQMAEQTKKDAAELQHKLEQQISSHRQMVITELRSQAAIAAVRLAEASLPGALTANVKKGLQGSFVTQLAQIGNN